MPKPTDADRARFAAAVPDAPGVETKPMFGQLGAFVHGNMFMGLFGDSIGVKVSDEDRAELLALPGTGPFGPPERPMAGYVTLPADLSPGSVERWVGKALGHVSEFPAKSAKAKVGTKSTPRRG